VPRWARTVLPVIALMPLAAIYVVRPVYLATCRIILSD
jgi:hypothetical protein